MGKLLELLAGGVRLYADGENSDALVSFLSERNIYFRASSADGENGIYVRISPRILKNIASSLDKSGIIVYIINIYGFNRLLSKYRARPGIAIGAVLFFAILWLSTLFVWRVDAFGCVTVSREQLRAEMSEMGISPGCRISDIDRNDISNRFLSLHPEFSWVAVNINGTTVSLSVKETLSPPPETDRQAPLLVAKHDGIVTSVSVFEGCAVVKAGTVVKKGDVLISGYISGSGSQITDKPPLRTGNARGSVLAEISKKDELFVPFEETVVTEAVGEICGRRISVFGLSVDLGDDGELCREENLTVFGFIELPIVISEYREILTHTEKRERTPDEAKAEAECKILEKLSVSEGELLKYSLKLCESENGVTAILDYNVIIDICEKFFLTMP